jgi:L-serine dehydratase
MTIGVLDLFRVGIGPSSSHTSGPMRAAHRFVSDLAAAGRLVDTVRLHVELFGSLAATGPGHGTPSAIVLGLSGWEPHLVDPDQVEPLMEQVRTERVLRVLDQRVIPFDLDVDLVLLGDQLLPGHPNGMRFTAFDHTGGQVACDEYYSVGGGFIADARELRAPLVADDSTVPHPFTSADDLIERCDRSGLSIAMLAMENETSRADGDLVGPALLEIWSAMQACVERGCRTEGILPGGLGVKRRAVHLHNKLTRRVGAPDPLSALDWVNLWALAVNEENAAGGRVVTAPTNGAAGIVPAVLHYYWHFLAGADEDGVIRFLLTAGAIGSLFKMNASISGAEVGCQGEVGSACAMAAAGLTEVMGGSPRQVENAAEIALEHNLGLTCDPIGGLVQVPCIERNAMGAIKSINAARLAMHGDGTHLVSLDQAIETLRDTGRDMHDSYKETARGGLAVTFRRKVDPDVALVPVTVVEC